MSTIVQSDAERKPLTVYKASAGSGKTFTLAVEYIHLLIANPNNYRNILAVTFTNKATEEMKQRILSQLYGIWQGLKHSERYVKALLNTTPPLMDGAQPMSRRVLRERAGMALHNLLHNYSYFRVETIDSFFQSVLRNLARELDLTPNLRVGLNDTQVEEMAVDVMIDDLTERKRLLRWIMRYINSNISDDKNWNVISDIKDFGRTIFADFYRENSARFSEKLDDSSFFDDFVNSLRNDRDDAKKVMADIADEFFRVCNERGLCMEDFSNKKSGVYGFFCKISEGLFDEESMTATYTTCAGNPEKWVTKTNKRRDEILAVVNERLLPLLCRGLDERPVQWRRYRSAVVALRHLDQLRLLGSIERQVRTLNEDSNRFLLSDTQHLLRSLISDTDSPFIFEKIGSRLEHVMIDEFQDTGSTQWKNFRVLLSECMSHEGTQNLIVGDVKQSIYRWRSGDWRILNNIEHQFPASDRLLDIKSLDTNYRSSRAVIAFNNAFFTEAVKMETLDTKAISVERAAQLQHAYSDVCQKPDPRRRSGGYVRMTLLSAKGSYKSNVCAELCKSVEELLAKGVKPSSMVILVRYNKTMPLIADYFASEMPYMKVVSDEAFRLDASQAVNAIVAAMRLVTHPDDQIAMSLLQKSIPSFKDVDFSSSTLQSLSLYELATYFHELFHLEGIREQTAYLCTFFDSLRKYADDGLATIDGFLEEWESDICKKTVQGVQADGIRIVSIHKSKGLEFDHVIIPFCDWELEKTSGNIIWVNSTEYPYSELPFIPVDYSRKGLVGTVFEDDYYDEHFQNVVDNLNLLYVAFTRAKTYLHIIGKRSAGANNRSQLLEACMPQLAAALPGALLIEGNAPDAPTILEYDGLNPDVVNAELPLVESSLPEDDDDSEKNVFMYESEPIVVELKSHSADVTFMQSNAARDFVGSLTGDGGEDTLSYIAMGTLFHKVLSSIRTTEDIPAALSRLVIDGVLPGNASAERVRTLLYKRLMDERVADWFSNRWTLFNECSILSYDAINGCVLNKRPDRVMTDGRETIVVDFKFGKPDPSHLTQVSRYMGLLRNMAFPDVKGYLWYVYSNKIEEVRC